MLAKIFRYSYVSSARVFNPPEAAALGFRNKTILRNLSVGELYELGCADTTAADPATLPTTLNSTGALVSYSGKRTGRSPKDKRTVKDSQTEKDIWWGNVNIPLTPEAHNLVESAAVAYLNTRDKIFVVDGYAGWDPANRLKVRIYCSRVYHALFMRNMLIVPTEE
jgi:phosphoenolpyruvate carboxykinase (ATP)